MLSRLTLTAGLMLTAVAAWAQSPEARFPFVIPGDDAADTVTSMATLSPRAAGADGFVRVQDAHFFTDAGRLRLWGVNLAFAADFPEHADADKVAAHLAKLGVNAVRIHHHDTQASPRGIWGPVVEGHRTLDPNQIERLDYFLNALHRHGIYADLNLHVGREVTAPEGFDRTGLPYATRYDKYLLYFMPELRTKLKEFCREYLLHENPYRKLRRVDDPGVAIIEITNENAFSKTGPELAAQLPAPYRAEFKRQWNAWLRQRYGSTAALQAAWSRVEEPLGQTVIPATSTSGAPAFWSVKQSREFPVTIATGRPGPDGRADVLRVEPRGQAPELSAQELHVRNLALEPGRLYTLSFRVRADAPRTLHVDVSNAGPGTWSEIGYEEVLSLTPQWQDVRRVFRAEKLQSPSARLAIKFGGTPVAFELADVTLRRGSEPFRLPAGQSVEDGTVEIPVKGWADAARADVHAFMVDTERGFFADMVAFLKRDLGVRVPVTGSQLTYNPPEVIAATCDYADIHGYWQHPRFPHKPWDPVDWNIRNTPMEQAPDHDVGLERATWRLADKPFTMSEWNIPDPNDYAASVVPFAAMIAARQDWDGVFFFQYASGENWYADAVQRYFSFDGQPAKLALLTAFANLYRRGDLGPASDTAYGTAAHRVEPILALTKRVGIDPRRMDAGTPPTAKGKNPPAALAGGDDVARWDAQDQAQAYVRVNTPATRAVWGLIGSRHFDLGGISMQVGAVERNYAVVVMTSRDGKPLEQSDRVLIAAVGSAENVGYGWNADRTSLGNRWGHGPTQVNGVPVTLTWPAAAHVYALDGTGRRIGEVPAGDTAGTFALGPRYRTLWYEVVRAGAR